MSGPIVTTPSPGSTPTHRGRDWVWSAALVLAAHAALFGAAPASAPAPTAPARAQAAVPLVTVSPPPAAPAAPPTAGARLVAVTELAGQPLAAPAPVLPPPAQRTSAGSVQVAAQTATQVPAQTVSQTASQTVSQTSHQATAQAVPQTLAPATEAPLRMAGAAATPPSVAALPVTPSAATPAPEIPTYVTRFAPALRLAYDMRRGALSGSAELAWQPSGNAYTLALKTRVLGAEVFGLASRGSFDAAGLAPERFTDSRRGRDRQAANFERAAGRISYSGPSVTQPLPAGSQDRLSWMVQLPAIVDADPARWRPGARLELFVSGARGDADVWTFVVQGRESLSVGSAPVADALRLTREPRKPYDTQVEVWLDPARHHLPVRARMTVQPGGETLDLRLTGWAPGG